MSRHGEEPDTSPPRSLVDADEYRSRISARTRSPNAHSPASLPKSPLIYTNGLDKPDEEHGDADSNVQDGVRSEMGETILPIVRVFMDHFTCQIMTILYSLERTWSPRSSGPEIRVLRLGSILW